VNLVLNVQEKYVVFCMSFFRLLTFARTELEGKPIKSLDIAGKQTRDEMPTPASPIPRRKTSVPQSNGHTNGNGTSSSIAGKKRSADEALNGDTPDSKRSKIVSNGAEDGVIVLDDTDGAILIDDD
jgi:ubiquitin-like 1-activating enzyme E1 B